MEYIDNNLSHGVLFQNMTDQELLNALFRSVGSEYGLIWDAVALWEMEF